MVLRRVRANVFAILAYALFVQTIEITILKSCVHRIANIGKGEGGG